MEMFKLNGFLEGNFQSILSSFKVKGQASPIKKMRALAPSSSASPVSDSKMSPYSTQRVRNAEDD